MNEILISTYNILILILAGCFYMAFPPRGEVTTRDVGLINVVCGFFGVVLAFILRSMSLSGTLNQSLEYTSVIQNPTMYWLFFVVGIVLLLVTGIDVLMYFQQRLNDE